MAMTTLSMPLARAATSSAAGFTLLEDLSREARTAPLGLADRPTSYCWVSGRAFAEAIPASKAALAVTAKRFCRLRK